MHNGTGMGYPESLPHESELVQNQRVLGPSTQQILNTITHVRKRRPTYVYKHRERVMSEETDIRNKSQQSAESQDKSGKEFI